VPGSIRAGVQKASPHWMGHTFVRQALARGVPIEVVSELAVHGMRHRVVLQAVPESGS